MLESISANRIKMRALNSQTKENTSSDVKTARGASRAASFLSGLQTRKKFLLNYFLIKKLFVSSSLLNVYFTAKDEEKSI